jgi:hypothetical protein
MGITGLINFLARIRKIEDWARWLFSTNARVPSAISGRKRTKGSKPTSSTFIASPMGATRDQFSLALQGECQMLTQTTPRIALVGIALSIIFVPVLSGKSQAQQIDPKKAAEAKAQAGREALSHPPIDPPGPKAAGTFITFDAPGAGTGSFQGTFPTSVNQAGEITGAYLMQTSWVTGSCGPATALSLRLMCQPGASTTPRGPASTQREPSRDLSFF